MILKDVGPDCGYVPATMIRSEAFRRLVKESIDGNVVLLRPVRVILRYSSRLNKENREGGLAHSVYAQYEQKFQVPEKNFI